MKKTNLLLFASLFILAGCAELMQLASETQSSGKPLSQTEVVAGLKEALIVGTGNSAKILGNTDGYYKDELVKILLPPEADIIVNNINRIPGGEDLLEDLLLRINRAAEDAATEAKPIFVQSITGMTIADAWGILKGGDNAATQYLQNSTSDQLFDLYRPKIKASVDKKLVGNISTGESWDQITGKWNSLAQSAIGKIAGFKPVEIQLDEYLTTKALDGMFLKIAAEEKEIRNNPMARVNNLLKRVFGQVDN